MRYATKDLILNIQHVYLIGPKTTGWKLTRADLLNPAAPVFVSIIFFKEFPFGALILLQCISVNDPSVMCLTLSQFVYSFAFSITLFSFGCNQKWKILLYSI